MIGRQIRQMKADDGVQPLRRRFGYVECELESLQLQWFSDRTVKYRLGFQHLDNKIDGKRLWADHTCECADAAAQAKRLAMKFAGALEAGLLSMLSNHESHVVAGACVPVADSAAPRRRLRLAAQHEINIGIE